MVKFTGKVKGGGRLAAFLRFLYPVMGRWKVMWPPPARANFTDAGDKPLEPCHNRQKVNPGLFNRVPPQTGGLITYRVNYV